MTWAILLTTLAGGGTIGLGVGIRLRLETPAIRALRTECARLVMELTETRAHLNNSGGAFLWFVQTVRPFLDNRVMAELAAKTERTLAVFTPFMRRPEDMQ